MTASPTPTDAVPGDVGLPSEEEAHAMFERAADNYDAWEASTGRQTSRAYWKARALSAEAKLAQAVEELSGLRQAILDAAVICDDDEKAGDRLDKLARAIRARSASRGEKT